MRYYYQNAEIFDGEELITNHSLVVEDGKVACILADDEIPNNGQIIKLDGGIITPGYVEIQANGGGGVLFNDAPTIKGIKTILTAHRRFGTIAMLPTFITDTQEKMALGIKAIEQGLKENIQGLLGGHFEGPFLNIEKKGTHLLELIRKPNDHDLQLFQSHSLGHSLVTLAPENAPDGFIKALTDAGYRISAGHSMATKDDMIKAHQQGLSGVTHLYNAMPPLAGRAPSVMGSAVALSLYSGIIVDGIHSDPFSLQLAYKAIGADKLMLVTDSMHTIGAPSHIDEFMITGQKVYVQGDRLVNEHGSLAGAHITMEQSVKNAVNLMGATTADALKMAISTPAKFMGCPELAIIIERDVSDILWLDDALNVSYLEHLRLP